MGTDAGRGVGSGGAGGVGEVLGAGNPADIDGVVARMDALDGVVGVGDGLRWFNRLYRMVTVEVRDHPPGGGWENRVWVEGLDVVFAGLYFDALRDWTAGRDVASAWKAFFAMRSAGGIDRIQFAVAGMNAHINHDLALALVKMDAVSGGAPGPDGPEWRDYGAVNGLLNAVMPGALRMLAGDFLGMAAEDTGKAGRLLAFWNICRARELAWDFAGTLRGLSGAGEEAALRVQDGMTGALGRAILGMV